MFKCNVRGSQTSRVLSEISCFRGVSRYCQTDRHKEERFLEQEAIHTNYLNTHTAREAELTLLPIFLP